MEADETFIGNDPDRPKKKGQRHYHHKMKVVSLVDRDTGRAKSVVVDKISQKTLLPILKENLAREARLMTDEAGWYIGPGHHFASHESVQHRKGEYVRAFNPEVHTNTIEGFFSIFKRGMRGVYQHCGKPHLHRYLAEFDFRYSNRSANGIGDAERADIVLTGIVGKRLTYETIGA